MTTNRVLVHKGSTKDVFGVGDTLIFKFSDRYSVFDWGEMPDHVPNKGLALAKFTKKIYRELGRKNVATHLNDVAVDDNEMCVTPYQVVRGDYSSLKKEENLFIPLEVIFRLGVAQGSSLLKRSNAYYEGMRFAGPVIEFTTKLERFDRPLTHEEAKLLGGFSDGEWKNLLELTSRIALFLQDTFANVGIELWDGKVEFAFGRSISGEREIVLVDSIGPDELRLSKDGVQLSKEIIRQYYKETPWYESMERGKSVHGLEFKNFVSAPEKLPVTFLNSISSLYTVLSEIILNEDAASLEEQRRILSHLMAELKGNK